MSCPNNIEIERKFLVRDDSYKTLATSSVHIRQGYLCHLSPATCPLPPATCPLPPVNCTIRVRVTDQSGFLTIKSSPSPNGFAHYEFEKTITVDEANELLKLALPGIIDKRRWLIPLSPAPCHLSPATCSDLLCEVDEFFGDNAGLVMAEVELPTEDTPFFHPSFLGDEVTFDKRYYNSYLAQHPFTTW